MCLKEIKKIKLHKNYGWQVFYDTKEGLLPFYMNKRYTRFGRFVPTNTWEKDEYPMVVSARDTCEYYMSGFHIFLRKRDAEQMLDYFGNGKACIIRKVYFRNVITTGYQAPRKKWPVVVAAERFVED